jgi:hypothetical protein
MKKPRKAKRETEFQRFAKAARKAGLIVTKSAYDAYYRARKPAAAKLKAGAAQ